MPSRRSSVTPRVPASAAESRARGAARVAGLALLLAWAPPALADEPATVAVFDFELIDTSLEGETYGVREGEIARLAMITAQLRRALAESESFALVDTTPAAATIAAAGKLHRCNGCAAAIAESLGATLALTGTVQKVSNLILNINIMLTEVADPLSPRGASVDIRGNTDESWSRGMSYLIRNRLPR